MQLSKFVTPAYFSVNSLFFFFFFHSFANSNFVGWCILALLKHHEYTDGPVCHNKPKHCHCILENVYFFLPPGEMSKVTLIALSLSFCQNCHIYPAEISFKASWQILFSKTQKPLSEKGLSVSLSLYLWASCSVSPCVRLPLLKRFIWGKGR